MTCNPCKESYVNAVLSSGKTKTFELPDKNITSVGAERFHGVVYCSSLFSLARYAADSTTISFQSVLFCDADIRKNLYRWHDHVPVDWWVRDDEIGSFHDEI